MSELYLNPEECELALPGELSRSAEAVHKRFPDFLTTPLHSLPDLAEECGVANVWLKDESNRLGLPAFKILGASYAITRFLQERFGIQFWSSIDELREKVDSCGLTFVSATDGNHGRGVARTARLLGLRAQIHMPGHSATARIDGIRSEGAEVVVGGRYDDAVSRAVKEVSDSTILVQDAGWPGYELIPTWIIEGYSTIFHEVDDFLKTQNERPPTHLVVQVGLGTLAHTAVLHYHTKVRNNHTHIVGIEPVRAACLLEAFKAGEVVQLKGEQDSIMAGMNCGTASRLSFPVLQRGLKGILTMEDRWAEAGMKFLADRNIVSGETGASGLGAMLALAAGEYPGTQCAAMNFNKNSRVLLISTEGATDPESYQRIVGRTPEEVRKQYQSQSYIRGEEEE